MSGFRESSHRILSGPLGLEVARFGTPLALGMGLQTAFNLVDAYIIGELSHDVASPALGAIGICDQLAALGTIVSYGFTVASGAQLSQKAGQNDHDAVRRIGLQSLILVLALSLVFGALGLFGATWFVRDAVGAKGGVAALGVPYLRVMMGGSFSIFLLLHLTGTLRALGSSKTPVLLMLVANVLNLFLAVVLVYGPGPAPLVFSWGPPIARALSLPRMELMGAAWATLLARVIVLPPLLWILIKRLGYWERRPSLSPDLPTLREIAKMGWPSSAQLVVRILAMLFTHALVARSFTTADDQSATTALGIVFRLETMALFIGLGWGSAAQTFIGQNLGATNTSRAKTSGWYAAAFNAVTMTLLALCYWGFGRRLVSLFDSDPNVVALGVDDFRWVGLSYVGLGTGVVLGSAIQGAGATRQALMLDAAVVMLLQLPASLLAVSLPHATPSALFKAVSLTDFAFALVHAYSYWRGRFLRTAMA
ncbi:MAG: MATE family efflux transporter [Polyangiaceae bacterium]